MPPPGPDRHAARRSDIAACRATLSVGSRTFFLASFLLPRKVREPASALYAFCRLADDEVDVHGGRMAAIDELRERLDRAYAGWPLDTPVDRAFADIVAEFAVPRALPEALLEGLQWDAEERRYEDLEDLHAYAARVAGTVGAMMTALMGVRDADVVARACDLGVAMQLSNIARDVGEDARAGHVYLPLRWLRDAGIDPDAWLSSPSYSEALGSVVRHLLWEADRLYDRADAGIARLPLSCRPGIYAAKLLYAEIGREVERHDGDSISRRAVVPASRKAALLGRALAATPNAPRLHPVPALAQTRFLVEALAPATSPWLQPAAQADTAIPWWNLAERIGRVLELFAELEERQNLAADSHRTAPMAEPRPQEGGLV